MFGVQRSAFGICLAVSFSPFSPFSISVFQLSAFETRSLPALTRSYPRRFAFYVALPIRSIQYFSFSAFSVSAFQIAVSLSGQCGPRDGIQ
jgi:hypothetical protein